MSGLQKIIKHKISEITAAVQPFSKHVVIVCLKVSVNPGSEEGVIGSIFSLDCFSRALKCHGDTGFTVISQL